MEYHLDDFLLKAIREYGDQPKISFKHIWKFSKTHQEKSSIGFQTTIKEIRDYMDERDINYGMLILVDLILVFTEDFTNFNPLMIKLATGINLIGEMPDNHKVLDQINKYLGR